MNFLTDLVSFKHSNCTILNKLHATSQMEKKVESEQRKEVDVRGKVAVKINENDELRLVTCSRVGFHDLAIAALERVYLKKKYFGSVSIEYMLCSIKKSTHRSFCWKSTVIEMLDCRYFEDQQTKVVHCNIMNNFERLGFTLDRL